MGSSSSIISGDTSNHEPELAPCAHFQSPNVGPSANIFPREHRSKIHSTNPIERLNAEIKRRTDVVGIFPNEAAIYRLVGALLLEQNDEWAMQRRYMTLETLAEVGDNPAVSLSAVTV